MMSMQEAEQLVQELMLKDDPSICSRLGPYLEVKSGREGYTLLAWVFYLDRHLVLLHLNIRRILTKSMLLQG